MRGGRRRWLIGAAVAVSLAGCRSGTPVQHTTPGLPSATSEPAPARTTAPPSAPPTDRMPSATPTHRTPTPTGPAPTTSGPAEFRAGISPIDPAQANRMGTSWHPGCPVPLTGLRVLTVSYWGFDDAPHTGRLIVAADQAEPVVSVFRRLFDGRFPVHVIQPVDAFGGSDDRSMAADNTSGFNCRGATGNPDVFSQHAYGLAIDLNPFENPYVSSSGEVQPPQARRFADRSLDEQGMIAADSLPVRAFADIGWEWGGSWSGTKDYQHFSENGH